MQQHGGQGAVGWTAGTTLLVWMMVVWTLIDLIVFTAGRDHVPWVYIVFQSIVLAQFATLAGWLALGDGGLLTRAICVAVAVLLGELMAHVNAAAGNDWRPPTGEIAAVFTVLILSLSLPLVALTAFGWRCRHRDEASTSERPFQFRIAQVLVLTTVVAALLGLWRIMPEQTVWQMMGIVVAALILSPLVVAQWFLQLRPRPRVMWIVALLVVLGNCVAAVIFLRREAPQAMLALALYVAALAANLALFRAWGYRLLRRNEQPDDAKGPALSR
jgi:hypothetical protein